MNVIKNIMKNISNKKLGNSYEAAFSSTLHEYGFWVHRLQQNATGQPADVIASRNGHAYLIDCKVCSAKGFNLDRIEDNQVNAMTAWHKRGNGTGWFAMLVDNETYMISLKYLMRAREQGHHFLSNEKIKLAGFPLEKWMGGCR